MLKTNNSDYFIRDSVSVALEHATDGGTVKCCLGLQVSSGGKKELKDSGKHFC